VYSAFDIWTGWPALVRGAEQTGRSHAQEPIQEAVADGAHLRRHEIANGLRVLAFVSSPAAYRSRVVDLEQGTFQTSNPKNPHPKTRP
jgi:hypothetical protein